MMNTNDMEKVYDTLLSIPGMNEIVKLDLKISRRQVLLLAQVIGVGLEQKGDVAGLLSASSAESVSELKQIAGDCLEKAGLTELSRKLIALQSK